MNTNFLMGDLLYRSKGPVEHAGVYLGNHQVLHNRPGDGVIITSLAEYQEGKQIKVQRFTEIDHHGLTMRLQMILQGDERYQLLSNNCESIANFLLFGRKKSPQIQATIIGAIAGGLLGKDMDFKGLLLAIAIGGALGCLVCNVSREYSHTVIAA